METLKYKVIKTERRYNSYCKVLEELVFATAKPKAIKEEIELLTLLIEKYDEQHTSFTLLNPVELLRSLMKEHSMKSIDLAKVLTVSEGLVSDMLNYKKGFSKEVIRKLAEHFKVNQEAFNRPYELNIIKANKIHNGTLTSSKKKLEAA